jgi:hypothetical protein
LILGASSGIIAEFSFEDFYRHEIKLNQLKYKKNFLFVLRANILKSLEYSEQVAVFC